MLNTVKLSAIALSIGVLTGCSNLSFLVNEHSQNEISQIDYTVLELQERSGLDISHLHIGSAEDELKAIKQRALSRYVSKAPRDIMNISLSKAVFMDDAVYNLRDVSIVISRGDSRFIELDDIDLRYSGVSTKLRITYAENQNIYLNGKKVGVYEANQEQLTDINVLTENGTLSALIRY